MFRVDPDSGPPVFFFEEEREENEDFSNSADSPRGASRGFGKWFRQPCSTPDARHGGRYGQQEESAEDDEDDEDDLWDMPEASSSATVGAGPAGASSSATAVIAPAGVATPSEARGPDSTSLSPSAPAFLPQGAGATPAAAAAVAVLPESELGRGGAAAAAGGASASNAAAGKSILSMLGRPDGEPPPSTTPPPLLQADGPAAAAAMSAALQQDPAARQGKTLSVAELFNFAQGKELPPIPQLHNQQKRKDDLSSGEDTTQKMQQEVMKMAQVMWASQHQPGTHQGNQIAGGGRLPSSSSSSCPGTRNLQHLQAQDAGRQYALASLVGGGGGGSSHHQHQHNVAAQYRVGQQNHGGAAHAAQAAHAAHAAHMAHQQAAWAQHYPYPSSCGGGYAAAAQQQQQQHGWPPHAYGALYQHVPTAGEPYQHACDGHMGGALQGAYGGSQAAALHGYQYCGAGFESSATDAGAALPPPLPRVSGAAEALAAGHAAAGSQEECLGETDAGCSQS